MSNSDSYDDKLDYWRGSEDELINPSATPEELAARIRDAQKGVRRSHGTLDAEERGVFSGRDSFHKFVDMSRNPGRSHTLKTHFYSGTAAYEVMGKFEWARKQFLRDDCFVFMSLEKLRRTCYKDHDNKIPIDRRTFFLVTEVIRDLGGVSPRLELDGHEGYIVPPHHALCVESEDGKRCTWVGPDIRPKEARVKLGLVGQFSLTPEGWIWRP